jgi:hypothetical protein
MWSIMGQTILTQVNEYPIILSKHQKRILGLKYPMIIQDPPN